MKTPVCTGFALFVLAASVTAQTTVTLMPDRDNSLYEDATGSLSNGAGTGLFCGVTLVGGKRRALIHFDVAGAIPAGSTVTSASLEMTVTMAQFVSAEIGLHLALADWGEGTSFAPMGQGGGTMATPDDVTWLNNFFPGSFWTSPGGDFLPFASASLPGISFTGPYSWASTAMTVTDVQGWIDNPATNYGWCLVEATEANAASAKRLGSRENVGFEPKLTIIYTPGGPTASAASTGTGCNGSSGNPATLTANGLPQLGNGAFALTLSGGSAGESANFFAAVGLEPAPISIAPPGCFLYLDLLTTLTFINLGVTPVTLPTDSAGSATVPFPVPSNPGLGGARLDIQGVLLGAGGVATSNAVTLILGN